MQPKDILEPLAKLGLPLLGAMLPIPGGAAIGTALASAIGAPSGKPEDILATLQASGDAVLKAKQFEAENRTKMLELTLAHEQAMYQEEVKDRSDARKMQSETKSYIPGTLAIGVTIGFFTILAGMMSGWLKTTGNSEALLVMLGALGTAWGAVVNYYFGSSASSKAKDDTLAAIAKS